MKTEQQKKKKRNKTGTQSSEYETMAKIAVH